MNKVAIIDLLNQDIEAEHGAIIQYLTHAYAMGEGELSCEIEALAREEMRHLDWLAETVVTLGGTPSLRRGKMIMEGQAPPAWMKNNVLLEEGAINQYHEHIEAIDDAKIKRLLKRILSDEESHHGDFEHFVDKTAREKISDIRGSKGGKIIDILNWGIAHEYTVILQYMFQSYMTDNEEAKKELEDQAINEMQHLGWLAEQIIDISGSPQIEHNEVEQTTNTAEMLRTDIAIEKKVAREYKRAVAETDNAGLKELLLRLRDHESYHANVFSDLLREEEK
ncbi:ferritin-like domain-containing protein [Chloroflexota bacterium]